jgi:hypothetical protein
VSDLSSEHESRQRSETLSLAQHASGATTDLKRSELRSQTGVENLRAGEKPLIFHLPEPVHGLEEELFRKRSDLKVITSQVAMHLTAEHRQKLFTALDLLLGLEHWEDESNQIQQEAFRTFLRFLIFVHPRRFPNLGVSSLGCVLAGWHSETKSLHAEFLPDNICTILLRSRTDRGPEGLAWRGPVARFRAVVEHNEGIACID